MRSKAVSLLRIPIEDSVSVLDDDFAFCLSHVRDSVWADRHLGGDFGDLGCLGLKHGFCTLRHSLGTGSSLQGSAGIGDEAVLDDFACWLRLVRDARRAGPMRGPRFWPVFQSAQIRLKLPTSLWSGYRLRVPKFRVVGMTDAKTAASLVLMSRWLSSCCSSSWMRGPRFWSKIGNAQIRLKLPTSLGSGDRLRFPKFRVVIMTDAKIAATSILDYVSWICCSSSSSWIDDVGSSSVVWPSRRVWSCDPAWWTR